jgi:hypothetical protein
MADYEADKDGGMAEKGQEAPQAPVAEEVKTDAPTVEEPKTEGESPAPEAAEEAAPEAEESGEPKAEKSGEGEPASKDAE